jgi:hypothetical protein
VLRKIIMWLVIGFALFYLLSAPADAAHLVRSAGHGLRHAASQLAVFFHSLV